MQGERDRAAPGPCMCSFACHAARSPYPSAAIHLPSRLQHGLVGHQHCHQQGHGQPPQVRSMLGSSQPFTIAASTALHSLHAAMQSLQVHGREPGWAGALICKRSSLVAWSRAAFAAPHTARRAPLAKFCVYAAGPTTTAPPATVTTSTPIAPPAAPAKQTGQRLCGVCSRQAALLVPLQLAARGPGCRARRKRGVLTAAPAPCTTSR